jgi:RNA polymerase sigma-70 factor (ECF subfamily)
MIADLGWQGHTLLVKCSASQHPMKDPSTTRPSLLLRVRDATDEVAWSQFVEIYTPLFFGYCRGRGLQEADAADVAQESMCAVAKAMGKFEYDPQRGRFRNWLLTVVQSKLHNFHARQQRQPALVSETTLQSKLENASVQTDESLWEADYYRTIFRWAAERIRLEFQSSTWEAFWRTTIEERDGKEVANSLGLSVGAVYVAKSRVIARLREEIQSVDAEAVMPPEFLL